MNSLSTRRFATIVMLTVGVSTSALAQGAPAAPAAGEKAANTPAPSIEPIPMITASKVPSRRASPGWLTGKESQQPGIRRTTYPR